MNAGLALSIDTHELEQSIAEYAALRNKDVSALINKKMCWLLRRALWKTPKADYARMGLELGQALRERVGVRRGSLTMVAGQKSYLSDIKRRAPFLALIINRRRGRAGKPGLYGKEMSRAFRKTFGARARSIGYLKQGWAQAMKPFLPFGGGGGPPRDNTPIKPVGRPKGFGTLANALSATATALNAAWTKRARNSALLRYARPALLAAYREELADFRERINEVLYESARRSGTRARK